MYSPEELEVTVRVNPVPVCVTVTRAPGTAAPDESRTVPRSVPVTACPQATWGSSSETTARPSRAIRAHLAAVTGWIVFITSSERACAKGI